VQGHAPVPPFHYAWWLNVASSAWLTGLAIWDRNWGLRGLPAPPSINGARSEGAQWLEARDGEEVTVSHLRFEPETGNLYVAGNFVSIGGCVPLEMMGQMCVEA
jgi:hypothetical protein